MNEPFFTPGGLLPAVAEIAPDIEAAAEKEEDFLSEVHSFAEVKDNLPPLKEEVIMGLLRQGHKMIISAPSKAGKSYMLIQLAIALAEGRNWVEFVCRTSRVLYLNFEIDEPSFFHRVDRVYKKLDWSPLAAGNLFIKNLRGKKFKADDGAKNTIIAWAQKCRAEVIILDPIYKMMLNDENSAGDIGNLCRFFDEIAEATGASIVYAHHFAKGIAALKDPIDRASGSGVFARDPDAIVVVTPSNQEGYYVMEFSLREFKPVGRRGVRREDMVMVRDADADDLPLQGEPSGNAIANAEKREGQQKQKRLDIASQVPALLHQGEAVAKTAFRDHVRTALNISKEKATEAILFAVKEGLIVERPKHPGDNVPSNVPTVYTLPLTSPEQEEFRYD